MCIRDSLRLTNRAVVSADPAPTSSARCATHPRTCPSSRQGREATMRHRHKTPPGSGRACLRTAGFTLVELVVAMGLFAVLLVVLMFAIIGMIGNLRKTQGIADASGQARVAFDRLDRQLRYATAVNRPVLVGQDWYLDFARSRLFPGVNDSGRRFFSITTKISRRDPRPCPHEYHPPIVYTPRSTRCSPPVTTWRPPWSRWPGSVPSCCCRPRWRRRSPASSAGTATPARRAPTAPRPATAAG